MEQSVSIDHTIFADVWYDVLTNFQFLLPRLYWCLLSNCEGKSQNVENLLETVRYHDVILGFVMQAHPETLAGNNLLAMCDAVLLK